MEVKSMKYKNHFYEIEGKKFEGEEVFQKMKKVKNLWNRKYQNQGEYSIYIGSIYVKGKTYNKIDSEK